MRVIPYHRAAAVQYAKRWAFSRNPAYYNFDGIGGDCTNFVSQCIFAGANVMNYTPEVGWFYRSVSDRTASWTGVKYFSEFIVNNASVGPYGHFVSIHQARVGDVVQLCNSNGDFYHTLLVVENSGNLLVAAHSDDALNRPLHSYYYADMRVIQIDGVRIW